MNNTVTALIADDEKPLRDYLRQQLQSVWPALHIVAEAENGFQALELIAQHRPDICFLDIKMPGKTGLQVAREIHDSGLSGCQIVFSTAYDEYAIQAFENAAVDYLVKPITLERLEITAERLLQRITRVGKHSEALSALLEHLEIAHQKKTPLKWIRAMQKNEVHLLAVEDVLYFQSADKYTSVFTKDKEYLLRTTLKELEAQLDSDMFWRIHRGTIVQVAKITVVKKDEFGHLHVSLRDTAAELSVSRNYQNLFKSS